MERIYETLVKDQLAHYKQMIFLAGARQVGKTTIGLHTRSLTDHFNYLNWDEQTQRNLIMKGAKAVAEAVGLGIASQSIPIVVFDEIHKYRHWKTFLKGFYDLYKEDARIIVTGSAKLDIYRVGGDSLMGRYFPYRVHPLSVAECLRIDIIIQEYQPPAELSSEDFLALLNFGGFPEPFLNKNARFSRRWQELRKEQLFREDIRDLSRIQELRQMEVLAEILVQQVGQLVNYSNLANKIRVSVDTVRRWIDTLSTFYYCYTIRPWSRNVTRSLLKEPKVYLWDWSLLEDPGKRAENFVASHLLKAVHFWTDLGLGKYELYFLRDKEKREVDFIVVKNNKPWFLVEVKTSGNTSISKNLYYFQQQLQVEHTFQVAFDMPYKNIDCFSYRKPVIVPAQTLLSQLI